MLSICIAYVSLLSKDPQNWYLLNQCFPHEFRTGCVSIYHTSTDSKVGVGSLMDKAILHSLPAGSMYMEEVHVKVCSY
jgi:hypothetical protein